MVIIDSFIFFLLNAKSTFVGYLILNSLLPGHWSNE